MLCNLKMECISQAHNKSIQYLAHNNALQYYMKYSTVTLKLVVPIAD